MNPVALLYPLLVMVALTFAVAVWLIRCRIVAVRDGLNPLVFCLNRGGKLPDRLVQAAQHYENLFEMPVLFYLAILVAYVTNSVDVMLLTLAWGYVGLRVMHSWIHLGSNNLRWRVRSFVVSSLVLLGMWCWLLYCFLLR